MKRIVALVLCLALALSMAAAQAVSLADVVGRWYVTSADGKGVTGESYVEFNRDRSVTLVLKGEAVDMQQYRWELDDETIWVKQSDNAYINYASFDVKEGGLESSNSKWDEAFGVRGYTTYLFAREPMTFYTPEVAEAAEESVFFGDFEAYMTVENGAYVPRTAEYGRVSIAEYVAKVSSEGGDEQEYLTNFENGSLTVYADRDEYVVRVTTDPDVLVYNLKDDAAVTYLRRVGTQASAADAATVAKAEAEIEAVVAEVESELPEVDEAVVEALEDAVIEAEAEMPAVAAPVFPSLIGAAEDNGASAFYGKYIVYKDVLANGRVLDMMSQNLIAEINQDGVSVTANGKTITVPFEYKDGQISADIRAVYAAFGYAAATVDAETGELVVTLANAAGEVGETLYLQRME